MKILKYSFSILLAVATVVFVSCDPTFVNPLPEFETGVSGYASVTSANATFLTTDSTKPVSFRFRWNSIDGKNTVTKIEMLTTLTETYTDKDGNTRTANYGQKTWKVVEGSNVPANNTFFQNDLTQLDIYNLYKDKDCSYCVGGGKVLTAPKMRKTMAVTVNWVLTTADGRKFSEWGADVCGSTFGVVCSLGISVK